MPQRIQRKRIKGWRMPEGAVYVGRPTKWGNPFTVVPGRNFGWGIADPANTIGRNPHWVTRQGAAQVAVELYELHTGPIGNYEWDDEQVAELESLRGMDLACWCPLDQPCHADVLLRLANEEPS